MSKQTYETALKRDVKKYLNLRGWFVFHCLQGLGCYPGISDLIACKDGKVWFIECKSLNGKMSEKQMDFEQNLIDQKCNYLVVRKLEDIMTSRF